ncbi:Iron-sulfur cluster repair protein ScdA [Jeotgalibaca dankookensis]|uniref:Iron-sulfur cluster repair protein ScdA n=1 Tax=Jeotgalibaca dankookensis TaxID=708126 RepID=A0A1S6IPQ9_9LACT|nr:hypothetical protein [Jeotgalibaca dankookensis]AQS53528.1 Iron-sulfur cluster repair protein ScdA [Jeotgalibaca dankookensis]
MTTYNELADKQFEKLDLFSKAITRAHGKNHPEAFQVRELFETIAQKTEQAKPEKPNLDVEFDELRDVTDHYSIPNDVCETYAAVYEMFSQLDEAYTK